MEIEITNTDKFICDKCGEGTEFKGDYYNHAPRKLCPFCATEDAIEIINHN